MHRRFFLIGAAALAACTRDAVTPQAAPGPDPAAIIAPIYQPYIANSVLVGLQDQAPWTPPMREALEAMLARAQSAGEPILDFDPIIGAQDYQLSGLSLITEALVANSHAVVRARFSNLGRETEISYDMVWLDGGWRVDNVRGEDWDLRQIAAAP